MVASLKEKIKNFFKPGPSEEEAEEEYVELDTTSKETEDKSKILVRPYTIEDFPDIKGILDTLREGKTISLVNIKPLKDKDLIELKRAVNKIKKTCDAVGGDIAGFGEDWLVVVPDRARIYRSKQMEEIKIKGDVKDDE
ncbi:cell division protein SepF [Candidatus Woesearchaeota archaeon]|nr:cell division protein SepF [Candidatus Woesearchaeota archaeon]